MESPRTLPHDDDGIVRVVLAEDQVLVRAGLAMVLADHPRIAVLAQCGSGTEAVQLARDERPDVVVMDVRMPGLDGIEATRAIVSERAGSDQLTKVLMLTTFGDDETVYAALRAGASGFVLKHVSPADLVAAVLCVAEGNAWLDPAVTATVLAALSPTIRHGTPSGVLNRLTSREREVLTLMADGLGNAEIAARLVLSAATVRTHVSRVIMKTGSRDRTQAVALAYRLGLVVVDR